ncbi:MAG TPA: DegT/DnrJ/EryC1/StrS family aminotransferase [Syntrophorhabdales bacterium]|nr:DegT/DnrJ/EryC1/StrS family aminotransferase [Syntrophorhabdales bacterium]
MKVPFLDLKAQYNSIKDEIGAALERVLENTAFAGGPFVAQFEKEFAAFCGTKHAIGVGSGTEALWAALIAVGVGPGDEVITVPSTFIATAEAISFCGARPVFVDIEETTYNMDPAKLEAAITPRTKAVIPVHLFGQMSDMGPIVETARKRKLYVIEDAAQAHGAEYKGKKAGSIGDVGCFSFYPGKNLGAYGEAGAAVTNNDELADKMRMFRDHGQPRKYYHDMIGWNARMDGFQGAVLSVKLKHIDAWNEARRSNARLYTQLLTGANGLAAPREADYGRHVYHIYAVRVRNRDAFMTDLGKKEIATGIHYPVPLHLTGAYNPLGYKAGDFPVAERCADEFVSLPMFPELTAEQIDYVAKEVKAFLKS